MIKILAIDDIDDNLNCLGQIIKDAFPGSLFISALDGTSGIELAIANDPDVIVLDIVMPDLDGFDVCRILKRDDRIADIPVVFLTSTVDIRQNRIKALEVGAEAFLSKPIDEIENKIAGILQEHKITEDAYKVIQLRFGDKYIHEDQMCDPALYLTVYIKILNILSKEQIPFILLSDSARIANSLKKDIPVLHYWDNQKIHLGDLKKENLKESIFDTMTDFFILSKAKQIFSLGSGFSKIVSEIFMIPYTSLQDY